MPPVVPPFLVGLVVAPLAKRVLKPLVRGVVKTSVGLALEVKKAAQEAGENIHDLAAEVAADMRAAQVAAGDTRARSGDGRLTAAGNGVQHGETAEAARPAEAAPSSEAARPAEAAGRPESGSRGPRIRATAAVGKAH
ncbi:DUF5132 domain-containing protein [Kitasatospora sp. CM 4170]|uniref:DUF5132 domain-containing protein n=1 Tax=Kitasatospora aburaviensis TaxID=67265 RepID=A0ABW1F096_9ACTN|nr:DUF5132 domain-containing protein [Kitasatospora sp. CM 4170]WNM43841.1 DUF5132 domain-containing protein [Kitasatospora sp. CM 4170]